MGLNITAYREIKKLDCVFDEDGSPIDPKTREPLDYDFRADVNDAFPDRAAEVADRGIYVSAESLRFRAGSYRGYNIWRDELAKLAGYPAVGVDRYNTGDVQQRHDESAWAVTAGPFWELICFSDCDGVIGAAVSAKLAKDFAEFDERAKTHITDPVRRWSTRFYELYQQWRKAFEMAAQNGCVHFH